jgi:hypothetical protein
MKVRFAILVAVVLSAGSMCRAQDSPKVEATGDYSYFRLNPGLPSVWNSQNLMGLPFASNLQPYARVDSSSQLTAIKLKRL